MCTKTTRSLHVLLIKQIVVLESREKERVRQKEEKKRKSKSERGGGVKGRENRVICMVIKEEKYSYNLDTFKKPILGKEHHLRAD